MYAAWYACIVTPTLLAELWLEFSMGLLARASQLKYGVDVAFGEPILSPISI
jgi:hypothetical protein